MRGRAAVAIFAVSWLVAGASGDPVPAPAPAVDPVLIDALYDRGVAELRAGTYRKALETAGELLKLAPDSSKGQRLRFEAEAALRRLEEERMDLEKRLRAQEAGIDVDKRLVARDPEGTHVRPTLPERPPGAMTETEKKLRETRISMNVMNAPLVDVLDYMHKVSGLNIVADRPALQGISLDVNVKEVPVLALLEFLARKENFTYRIDENGIWIMTADPASVMWETRVIPLRKGLTSVTAETKGTSDLEGLMDKVKELLPPKKWPDGSTVYLDPKMNTLFVKSSRDGIAAVEEMVAALDKTPAQVRIETLFLQIDDNDLDQLGVEFRLATDMPLVTKDGTTRLGITAGTGTRLGVTSPSSGGEGGFFQLKGVLRKAEWEATLHALRKKTKAKALTSPRIIALNNYRAVIEVRTDLVYIVDYRPDRAFEGFTGGGFNPFGTTGGTSTFTNGDDDTPPDGKANEDPVDGKDNDGDGSIDEDDSIAGNLKGNQSISSEPIIRPIFNIPPGAGPRDEGVTLAITPSIGADMKEISLLLEPSVDTVVRTVDFTGKIFINGQERTLPTITIPIVQRRELTTKLAVDDGSTVVLGGLMSDFDQHQVTKVPLLGDIPYLGRLFRHDRVEVKKSNLMIFVTAEILAPDGRRYVDAAAPAPPPPPVPSGEAPKPPAPPIESIEVEPDAPPAPPPLRPGPPAPGE